MPDNAGYFHAAYGIAIALYVLYSAVLLRRRARVRDALAREDRSASSST